MITKQEPPNQKIGDGRFFKKRMQIGMMYSCSFQRGIIYRFKGRLIRNVYPSVKLRVSPDRCGFQRVIFGLRPRGSCGIVFATINETHSSLVNTNTTYVNANIRFDQHFV